MKKSLLVFTILISMFSVVNVSQANANCTAENPCGTWAMLDNSGTVTNVIVCSAAVCGGGTFAGQTVVPQVAPNPATNDTTGTRGYNSSPSTGEIVTYSDGKFIISENTTINNSVTEIDNNTTTESSVSVSVSQKSFTYEDTINKSTSEIIFNPIQYNESDLTILKVSQQSSTNFFEEYTSFYERKTEQEIQTSLSNNGLNLLLSKVQTLISLLGTWVK